MGPVKFLSFLSFLLLAFISNAFSVTYYVDSVSGLDTNNGTSQATAWKSVPGMTGSTVWGAITTANKIPAGTIIEVKAGSNWAGKRWLINSTYFQQGTSALPITIQVSSSWGTGNVVLNGTGATVPAWNGGVQLTDINYIVITGFDATRRFEFKNFNAHAQILHYRSGTGTVRSIGNQLKWFDCHHSSNYCMANAWQDDLLYQDGIAHNNGSVEGGSATPVGGVGIIMGDGADATGTNNVIRRIVSYQNGAGAAVNDGSVSFGFQITGGTNTLFENCEAYGNGRDGFDGGRADNAGNASMTFVNNYSHDNHEDGFGLNSGPTGNVTAIHVNTVSTRNGQANWTIYDGAHIELYHVLGAASSANIHSFASFSNWPKPTIKIRNSYFMALNTGAEIIQYYNPVALGYPIFDSNYNIYVPFSSNTQRVDNDTANTYANGTTWKGANDRFGLAAKQNFIDAANDNYRLADTTGPSNNSGTYINVPAIAAIDWVLVNRGNPPDIGPFENGGAGTPPTLVTPVIVFIP
jgi:hypothetical protein